MSSDEHVFHGMPGTVISLVDAHAASTDHKATALRICHGECDIIFVSRHKDLRKYQPASFLFLWRRLQKPQPGRDGKHNARCSESVKPS